MRSAFYGKLDCMRISTSLFLATLFVGNCSPIDAESVATCKEFTSRLFDRLDECGVDSARARADFTAAVDCENAVEVKGDPISCAEEFEALPCDQVSLSSLPLAVSALRTGGTRYETIVAPSCDVEILLLPNT